MIDRLSVFFFRAEMFMLLLAFSSLCNTGVALLSITSKDSERRFRMMISAALHF